MKVMFVIQHLTKEDSVDPVEFVCIWDVVVVLFLTL